MDWVYVIKGLQMLGILLAVVFAVFAVIGILRQAPLLSDKFRIPKEWKKDGARIDAEIAKQVGGRYGKR